MANRPPARPQTRRTLRADGREGRHDLDDELDDDPGGDLDPDPDRWGGDGPPPSASRRDVRAGLQPAAATRLSPGSRGADALAAVAARWGVTPRAVLGVLVLAVVVVATLGLRAALVQRQSVPEPVVPTSSLVARSATAAGSAGPPTTAGPLPGGATTPSVRPSGGAAATAAASAGGTPTGTVVVDVVGQVRRPGVVELPAGSRVHEAVAAAGGAVRGADLAQVNLARVLGDGEQLVVPKAGQTLPPGGPVGPAASSASGTATAGSVVDLNTATAGELDSLPGVGPVLAQRILDWRDANGRFSSVDELSEVSGIGDAVLTGLRARVRV